MVLKIHHLMCFLHKIYNLIIVFDYKIIIFVLKKKFDKNLDFLYLNFLQKILYYKVLNIF